MNRGFQKSIASKLDKQTILRGEKHLNFQIFSQNSYENRLTQLGAFEDVSDIAKIILTDNRNTLSPKSQIFYRCELIKSYTLLCLIIVGIFLEFFTPNIIL